MIENREWSIYWQSGQLGSCITQNAVDGGVLKDLWRTFADRLSNQAKVVDLATGNGSVVALLDGYKADLNIWGYDKANIKPPAGWLSRQNIRMQGLTDICSLPIEAEFFDAATSQFGVEYADPSKAFAEISRVLKPGAIFQFVVHHDKSEILKGHRNKLDELRLLLGDSGLICTLIAFARDTKTLEALEAKSKNYLKKITKPSKQISWQVLDAIQQLVHLKQQGKAITSYVDDMHLRMKAENQRLFQLTQAALSTAEIKEFINHIEISGLNFEEVKPVYLEPERLHIISWLFIGGKP